MSDPVLCTLAKHHLGDHDERGTAARSACRKVIRYTRPPIDPVDVPPEGGEPRDPAGFADLGEAARAAENPPLPASTPPGPSCARRGAIVTAWLGDPPPGWKPGMRPPCIACGAESGEECRKAAPPEPSTQDLIAAAVGAWGRRDGRRAAVQEARFALEKEGMFLDGEEHGLLLPQSALAKHVGHGKLVLVGGATFKAIAPRKPRGGELAADALWRLEPVEVAK